MDCIFCRIAQKELGASLVGETENTLSFLDINPVSPGHCLVIPKAHYQDALDCPPHVLSELMVEAQKLAVLVKDRMKAEGINLVNANGQAAQQSVFHLHFHVVPRFTGDGLNVWFHGPRELPPLAEVFQKLTRKN